MSFVANISIALLVFIHALFHYLKLKSNTYYVAYLKVTLSFIAGSYEYLILLPSLAASFYELHNWYAYINLLLTYFLGKFEVFSLKHLFLGMF